MDENVHYDSNKPQTPQDHSQTPYDQNAHYTQESPGRDSPYSYENTAVPRIPVNKPQHLTENPRPSGAQNYAPSMTERGYSPSYQPSQQSGGTHYVHPKRPRKTQPTITEGQNTKYPGEYTHDSNISVGGGGPLSGAPYRRSRSHMKRLRKDLHYGQYLEIPKGRRSIFSSQERARHTRSVITFAVVIAIIVIAIICIISLVASRVGA